MRQRGEEFITFNKIKHIEKKDYSTFEIFSIEYNTNQIVEETAKLWKPVDTAALEKAVETLVYVYPTFRECFYIEDGELYSYYSDKKPSVFCDEGTLDRGVLDQGKINPYEFRVSYERYKIRLVLSHSLTDGHGTIRAFNTLLYYYFVYAGEKVIPDVTVTTLESPCDKTEFESANDYIRKIHVSPQNPKPPVETMTPFAATVPLGEPYSRYELRFPLSQLLKLSKSTESSPISVVLPCFAQALFKLCDNPKNLPVLIHAPLDLRPVIGMSSMNNSSEQLDILYYPKMINMSMDLQSTMVRGQIDLQLAYPEHLVPEHDPHMVMPIIARMQKKPNRMYDPPTLSNIGKINMSQSMAELVEDIVFDAFIPNLLLSYSGITTFKGEVCMFFDHKYRDTSLFDAVCEIMGKYGITATGHDCGKQHGAKLMYVK